MDGSSRDTGSTRHLFLLCGLPFSGKSTMGRALEQRYGILHVEVDRHHLGGHNGFEARRVERGQWIAAYQEAYRQVEAALDAGRPVVFDAVSYRRTQRDRIRRIATKHGVPMTVIYLDVPAHIARSRLEANRLNPIRVSVPVDDFDEVARGMQPPMADEQVLLYTPDEPLAEWIEREIGSLVNTIVDR